MNKNHKWYHVAKEWLEGKPIQYRYTDFLENDEWTDLDGGNPRFESDNFEWRVAPHKWQDMIDAQAAGAQIQVRSRSVFPPFEWAEWRDKIDPNFYKVDGIEYRVKRRWQNEIDAFERGEKVQFRTASFGQWNEWSDCDTPIWIEAEYIQYRVKPAERKITREVCLSHDLSYYPYFPTNSKPNLRITWDIDTDEFEVEPL